MQRKYIILIYYDKLYKKYVLYRYKKIFYNQFVIPVIHKFCYFNLSVSPLHCNYQYHADFDICHDLHGLIIGEHYFKNICSRPSCYQCHFKTINRVSDITIFDCWDAPSVSSDFSSKGADRKSTRLNSSHSGESRMPSSA